MEWYEKWPKLPVEEFVYENCGARSGEPPPYKEIHDFRRGMIGIKGEWGLEKLWQPIGYTTDLVIRPRRNEVAIMFENQQTFEKVWWHFTA